VVLRCCFMLFIILYCIILANVCVLHPGRKANSRTCWSNTILLVCDCGSQTPIARERTTTQQQEQQRRQHNNQISAIATRINQQQQQQQQQQQCLPLTTMRLVGTWKRLPISMKKREQRSKRSKTIGVLFVCLFVVCLL
jgi:hypothetical protein